MATGPVSAAVRHLRKAALLQGECDKTNGQLLEGFLARREEVAFEALVRRHGPMVLGVCRRVLRHAQDAEDAFQATFLVLVRKAASLRHRETVGNWLYGVAYHTALKARAASRKRRAKEQEAAAMPRPTAGAEGDGREAQQLLDQELSALPDKYREPVVLCDLQGKTRKEAARLLGCPEGTLSTRLARARARLAKRLAGRGLALSGGAAAGVPASLVASTVKAAATVAAGQAAAGVVSAQVVALTEGVMKAMLLARLKVPAAVLLAVLLFGAAVAAAFVRPTAAAEAAPAPKVARVQWEYKALSLWKVEELAPKGSKDKLGDGLNRLGRDGWELVALEPGTRSTSGYQGISSYQPATYLFKRPK